MKNKVDNEFIEPKRFSLNMYTINDIRKNDIPMRRISQKYPEASSFVLLSQRKIIEP